MDELKAQLSNLESELNKSRERIKELEAQNKKLLQLINTRKLSLIPVVNLKLNNPLYNSSDETDVVRIKSECFSDVDVLCEDENNWKSNSSEDEDHYYNQSRNNEDNYSPPLSPSQSNCSTSSSTSSPNLGRRKGPEHGSTSKSALRSVNTSATLKSKRISRIRSQRRRHLKRKRRRSFNYNDEPPKTCAEFVTRFFEDILRKKCDKRNTESRSSLLNKKRNFDGIKLRTFETLLQNKIESLFQDIVETDPELATAKEPFKIGQNTRQGPVIPYVDPNDFNQSMSSMTQELTVSSPKEHKEFEEDAELDLADQHDQRTSNSLSEFPCHVCKKILRSAITLKNHLMVHEGKLPFVCDVCGASFAVKSSLIRHIYRHGEKTVPCPDCGKMFKTKDDMQKHVTNHHTKIKRFKCSMCPKAFSDASGIRRHERRHLGIKNHLCCECGRGFPEANNLRLHMKSQHGGNELPYRVKYVA